MAEFRTKPFGRKCYGSIPHLPTSKMGPGEHRITEGQARILCEKTRDKHDVIVVQEKVDGSNVAVRMLDGQVLSMTRAGYLATTSPYEQHHVFAAWVRKNEELFRSVLCEGWQVSGEWLYQASSIRYGRDVPPFVVFDVFVGGERITYLDMLECLQGKFETPTRLNPDFKPLSIERAREVLGDRGFFNADPFPEGAVWRVERNGKVDFLAKWVNPAFQPGALLPEVSGRPAVYNVEKESLFR